MVAMVSFWAMLYSTVRKVPRPLGCLNAMWTWTILKNWQVWPVESRIPSAWQDIRRWDEELSPFLKISLLEVVYSHDASSLFARSISILPLKNLIPSLSSSKICVVFRNGSCARKFLQWDFQVESWIPFELCCFDDKMSMAVQVLLTYGCTSYIGKDTTCRTLWLSLYLYGVNFEETSGTEMNLTCRQLMCTISFFSGQFITTTRKVTTQKPTTGYFRFILSFLYSLTLPHRFSFHRDPPRALVLAKFLPAINCNCPMACFPSKNHVVVIVTIHLNWMTLRFLV